MNNYETDNALKNFKNKDLRPDTGLLASTAKATIDDAKTRVNEKATEIQEEGYEQLAKIGTFFKEHPYKGAAYLMGAGALLGYLLLPRSRH